MVRRDPNRGGGSRIRFLTTIVLVAAGAWLTGRSVAAFGGRESAGDPFATADIYRELLTAIGGEGGPLASWWVHPECVACYHYLGSMLREAEAQRTSGATNVVIVLGQGTKAELLTRFLPASTEVVLDPTGDLFRQAGIAVTPQFIEFGPLGDAVRHGRGARRWGAIDDPDVAESTLVDDTPVVGPEEPRGAPES